MTQSDQLEAAWVAHPWVAEANTGVRFAIGSGPKTEWPAHAEFVQQVEAYGFDAYWTSDHPSLSADCWTTLAAVAAVTRRIRLGTLVVSVYYRSPVLLARLAADVDRISGGRLVLGLGIGDLEAEFRQLGVPCPSTRERLEALEETIHILRGLWGQKSMPPPGPHFGIDAPPLTVPPVQRPSIPLLIAGGGTRVTLRQVAQFADASNFGEHAWTGGVRSDQQLMQRLEALRGHCAALGRPPATVLRTHTTLPLILAETRDGIAAKIDHFVPPYAHAMFMTDAVATTPPEAVAYFRRLMAAGLQYFVAWIFGNDLDTVRLLAEQVMPPLRAESATGAVAATPGESTAS